MVEQKKTKTEKKPGKNLGKKYKAHKRPSKSRWKPIYLVTIYRMIRLGIPYEEVYGELKVSRNTFWEWSRELPELKQVIEMAEKEKNEKDSLRSWVYSRLSSELMAVWDRIQDLEDDKAGVEKIELMLESGGKRMRQQLFLHALCSYSFSVSQALAKVNVTKKELDKWIEFDHEFAVLVEEIQWHKGNLFEESLVKLVSEGCPAAVLFANKTYNAERGYASKSQVDVNISGQITHGVVDLAEIMKLVDEDTKLKVLEAVRRLNAVPLPTREMTVTEKMSQEIAEHASERGTNPAS